MMELMADVELKNDGKQLERFTDLMKTLVSVPKKEIQEREAKEKASKTETLKKRS